MQGIFFVDVMSESKHYKKKLAQINFFINDIRESFESSLNVWTKYDYYIQWLETFFFLLRGKAGVLILNWEPCTSLDSISGMMFSCYPIADSKYIIRQNLILNSLYFNNIKSDKINYKMINPISRSTTLDDNEVISEWVLLDEDINLLVKSICERVVMNG